MTLNEFRAVITELMRPKEKLRPFVCEGSPLACSIFVIGFNPATEIGDDFWCFWSDSDGFDRGRWMKGYKEHRRKHNKLEISQTRLRIDKIVGGAEPLKVLETNLVAESTATEREISNDVSGAIISTLIEMIRPRVILLHGKRARNFFGRKFKRDLKLSGFKEIEFVRCETEKAAFSLACVPHLSRGCSFDSAQNLGAALKAEALRDLEFCSIGDDGRITDANLFDEDL